MPTVRAPAVAGDWYPKAPEELAALVEGYLAAARHPGHALSRVVALIAPHAGLIYSGAVAAFAYRLLRDHAFDVAVLVGPSHFDTFDGVAVHMGDAFLTPLGPVAIDRECAAALVDVSTVIHERPSVHGREHSLEMQLPFLRLVAPDLRMVPLLMGRQRGETVWKLAEGLETVLAGRRALLVASTDLSHYHDASTAFRLDSVVVDHVERFDTAGLQRALERRPDHACGGGPMVAVMEAARRLGATRPLVLCHRDSGDVSGDKSSVVGYLAAALGA